MNNPKGFIQLLIGPRQTGKSTALAQAIKQVSLPVVEGAASLDMSSRDWVRSLWLQARSVASEMGGPALLVIDEIQLVPQWSSVVKELWDEDRRSNLDVRLFLSGSSSLLIQNRLKEGLTGRYEVIRSPHWSFYECKSAFGYTLDDFLFFGGYPASSRLKEDKNRWLDYMQTSIITPSVQRDVISLEAVRKPALMERLFWLGCAYSGQEVSYRKLMGQLIDAGNTTTLAHYLGLLGDAQLLCGLSKFSPKLLKERASSPRFMVYDTSLMVACSGRNRDYLHEDPQLKGHLVESAVGAYLLARSAVDHFEVHWWREHNDEVDFVLRDGEAITAIEVKSGRVKRVGAMSKFLALYPEAKTLCIAPDKTPLSQFLLGEAPLF